MRQLAWIQAYGKYLEPIILSEEKSISDFTLAISLIQKQKSIIEACFIFFTLDFYRSRNMRKLALNQAYGKYLVCLILSLEEKKYFRFYSGHQLNSKTKINLRGMKFFVLDFYSSRKIRQLVWIQAYGNYLVRIMLFSDE